MTTRLTLHFQTKRSRRRLIVQERPGSRSSYTHPPSLLLEDLMTDDEFLGDDSLNFNDIFDASLRAANDYDNEQDDYDVVDVINSLRQIMFG